MPKKAAWPKHTRPVLPTSNSRLSAKSAKTMILPTRSMPKEPANSGHRASAAKARMTKMNLPRSIVVIQP
jgi:hypothetical protein